MSTSQLPLEPPCPAPASLHRVHAPEPGDLGDDVALRLIHPGLLPYRQTAIAQTETSRSESPLESEPYMCEWSALPPQQPGAVLSAAFQLVMAQAYLAERGARCFDLRTDDVVVAADGMPRIWTPGVLIPTDVTGLLTADLQSVWNLCGPLCPSASRELAELLRAVARGDPFRTIHTMLVNRVEYRAPLGIDIPPVGYQRRRRRRGAHGAHRVVVAILERFEQFAGQLQHRAQTLRQRADRSSQTSRGLIGRSGPIGVAVLFVAVIGVLSIVLFPEMR